MENYGTLFGKLYYLLIESSMPLPLPCILNVMNINLNQKICVDVQGTLEKLSSTECNANVSLIFLTRCSFIRKVFFHYYFISRAMGPFDFFQIIFGRKDIAVTCNLIKQFLLWLPTLGCCQIVLAWQEESFYKFYKLLVVLTSQILKHHCIVFIMANHCFINFA